MRNQVWFRIEYLNYALIYLKKIDNFDIIIYDYIEKRFMFILILKYFFLSKKIV